MAHLREIARHPSLRVGKSAPSVADTNLREQRMRNPNDESIEGTSNNDDFFVGSIAGAAGR